MRVSARALDLSTFAGQQPLRGGHDTRAPGGFAEVQEVRNQHAQSSGDYEIAYRAVEKVRVCVSQLEKKTALQRFLQRNDISDSIKAAHHALDDCVEMYQVRRFRSRPVEVPDPENARSLRQ